MPKAGRQELVDLGVPANMAAGFYSGMATRALCQPLDVVKVRFQLQEEPIAHKHKGGGKYRSMRQALRVMVAEEGWRSLWKGHVPAQGLSVVYGAVQFGLFDYLSKRLRETSLSEPSAHFVAGTSAGAVAVTVAHPLDVVRTRFIAQCERRKTYGSGATAALRAMVAAEGWRSLFRGWVPAVAYVAPYAGINFTLYKACLPKRLSCQLSAEVQALTRLLVSGEEAGSLRFQTAAFFSGATSGSIAKAAVYPSDVIKKRLQIQGFEEARGRFGKTTALRGTRHALRKILRLEGVAGLYKGLGPSLVKAGAMSGLSFLFFEQAILLIRLYRDRHDGAS